MDKKVLATSQRDIGDPRGSGDLSPPISGSDSSISSLNSGHSSVVETCFRPEIVDLDSEEDDDSLSEMFHLSPVSESDEGLRKLLSTDHYLNDQYNHSLSSLKGLREHYYSGYLSILEVAYQVPSVSWRMVWCWKHYLDRFQKALDVCFGKMELPLPKLSNEYPLEKELFISLPSKNIDREIADVISQLELSLHYLTEAKLLKAIDDLLQSIYADASSTSSIEESGDIIFSIVQAIKAWDAFINQINCLSSEEHENTERRKNYLCRWHSATVVQCYDVIFKFAKHRMSQFEIALNLLKEEISLFQIQGDMLLYKSISNSLKFLDYTLVNLDTKRFDEHTEFFALFDKRKEFFQESCSRFFSNEMKQLYFSLNEKYEKIQNIENPECMQKYLLIQVYAKLNSTLYAWNDFVVLYGFPECTTREYQKWAHKSATSKAVSEDSLKCLFSLYASFAQALNLDPRPYETLEKKIVILKSIKQLIVDLVLLTKKPIHHEYKKSFNTIEKMLKEDFPKFDDYILSAIRLYYTKYKPSSLRVAVGMQHYRLAYLGFEQGGGLSNRDNAVQLYWHYFDSAKPLCVNDCHERSYTLSLR